ncbi:MAG: 30S ribosomal protein S2 [Candidatus Hydrogenedentes bacterium]|nr:30S ribosomal protein S2 [Candidatus Hydrogenedentota bacterium]
MAVVTIKQLLEAGIHFGHQTRRWNPKMARYIFGQRNGIYIIDLQKTLQQLQRAYALVRDTVSAGGTALFVGTKKQAQEPVAREAQRCGMYYVNNRWLGGTLTNFETIRKSIRTMQRLDEMEKTGSYEKLSKKEVTRLRKQYTKLSKNLVGIRDMEQLPDVVFVIDAKKEAIAIREAKRLNIPCIAVVDTNCDPEVVPVPIPGNDDAIRAVGLYCSTLADAVIDGRSLAEKVRADEVEKLEQQRKEKEAGGRAARRAGAPAARSETEPGTDVAPSSAEVSAEALVDTTGYADE